VSSAGPARSVIEVTVMKPFFASPPKLSRRVRSRLFALAGWAVAGAILPDRAAAAGDAVLENASVRVAIRDGRILALRDKVRSVDHVAPGGARSPGLFQLQWIKGIQPSGTLDASAMTARVVRRTADEVELAFEHPQASVRAQITLAGTPGETHWSLTVTPKDAALAVGHVAFPVVATPAAAGGGEKRYLFPQFEGRLQPLRHPPLWRSYPADLFAQMIACLAPTGGFLLWTDDGEGQTKSFGFARREGAAEFAVRHLPTYAAGREWRMPYRTRLSFCGGAWQDAADIYREWVTVQPWSGTAVRDRRDLPELLRHPPLCLSTQFDRENLDTLPERLAAWGRRFGTPIVYRPLGWEKHGNWVGIDYFPSFPEERRFRDLAAALQARDVTMAGFISGYRWTTKVADARGKRPADNAALARFFEQEKGATVGERRRDGQLLTFQAEGRDSIRICRGTAFGQQFLPATARRLFDLGVAVIHDDQDHGPYPGGQESCFDPTHGHPIPGGPWTTDVTRRSFQAIRAEAAERGVKDFFLTKESPSELLNMDLHGYQARLFHESSNPALVPLSQYLFHDRIPMIFGWVTANSRNIWDLAGMLVYGQVPSLAFWSGAAETPDNLPPEGMRLLDDYFAAMKTYAKDHLLYGRMRRPPIPNAPTARKEIVAAKGNKKGQTQVVTMPLVIQSAWDDGRGNVGVFAVNTQRQPVLVKVPAPGPGRWRATFYTGTKSERTETLATGASLAWSLAPGRLQAIVFTPGD
jgi:hypothetical protein